MKHEPDCPGPTKGCICGLLGRGKEVRMYHEFVLWVTNLLESWVPFIHYGTEA